MTWLVRFTVSFLCTVMLYIGAAASANTDRTVPNLHLVFTVFFAGLGWLGYRLLAARSSFLSPLASGLLWGSAAFCIGLMFVSMKYWQGFDEAKLLVLAFSQLLGAAVISFAAPRQIPGVKALTVAGGMAFILLAAVSLRILFLYFSILMACLGQLPAQSPGDVRILLVSIALGPVLGSAYLVATALFVLRLLGLVKALKSPPSEQRDKALSAAVRRFRVIALILVSIWWLAALVIWTNRLESLV
ncbi:MAG: hypothetical protein WC712_06615 [Candidatus Brocadiia bacterium]